jgi:hypothetical protein
LKGTDIGMTSVGVLGTAIGVVGLFTPLAPFAAATLLVTGMFFCTSLEQQKTGVAEVF